MCGTPFRSEIDVGFVKKIFREFFSTVTHVTVVLERIIRIINLL